MAKYLDYDGVSTLWQKCKDTFQPKSEGSSGVFISLDSLTSIELDSTNGLELNKWYKIDGALELETYARASSGQSTSPTAQTSYRSIYNGIFKITRATAGTYTSSPYARAYIDVVYITSKANTSAISSATTSGNISATATAGNYNKAASVEARFQGIITKLN